MKKTYPNLDALIGKTADMRVEKKLFIRVRIVETLARQGKVYLWVTPESGSGEVLVPIRRIIGAEELAGA